MTEGAETMKEAIVARFHAIPGLGLSKARILFEAGYTSIGSLQKAREEELVNVEGIGPSLARMIKSEVERMQGSPDEIAQDADSVTMKVNGVSVERDHARPAKEKMPPKKEEDVEEEEVVEGSSGIFRKLLTGFTVRKRGRGGKEVEDGGKEERTPVSIKGVDEEGEGLGSDE